MVAMGIFLLLSIVVTAGATVNPMIGTARPFNQRAMLADLLQ